MGTISERFINELGNHIALHVTELPGEYIRADGVRVEMSSRNSETDHTMTRMEAEKLRNALDFLLRA